MKHLFYIFITFLMCLLLQGNANTQVKDCKCKNIELKGRVKVVTAFADFKVKEVDSFPDLKVKKVNQFPDKCGEWQFVESGEDFTIQFVSSLADFTIMYVEQFPGSK